MMKEKSGYIIYLDILGYKNIVKSNEETEIKRFKTFLEDFINQESLKQTVSLFYNNFDENKFLFRCYSDNFLICYESDSENIDNFAISILLGSYLVGKAIKQGYMMRGSIVYGTISYDSNIIFGKSIIEAYELESSHLEPSVVLSSSLKKKYEENNLFNNDLMSPFSITAKNDYLFAKKYYEGIKILINRLNLQNIVDERTLSKYTWLINEFNRYYRGYASISFEQCPCHYSVSYNESRSSK